MTTRFDEDDVDGPEFAPDDPLMVILGPPGDRLAPPPGHYETLRRRASRRRLVRTATGVGVMCAVALLVALPFGLSRPDTPTSPAPPLAPPPASDRTTAPTPPPTPTPSERRTRAPSPVRTVSPTPTSPSRVPTSVPSGEPQPADSRTPDERVSPTAVPSMDPTRGAG